MAASMKDDLRRKGKEQSDGTGSSLFARLTGNKSEKVQMIMIREEKKSLVRIIKAKPKSVKHRSEVFKHKSVTEEEMKITEAVMRGVGSSARPTTAVSTAARVEKGPRYFVCVECGARVPEGSSACPKCREKYILDLSPESVAELERAQLEFAHDDVDCLELRTPETLPVLHFDALDGIISYLEPNTDESDFVLECSHCGTLVALDIVHCPMCGTELGVSDVGILSLLKDTEFDTESISELECPHCGEHVTLKDGVCPSCETLIIDLDASGAQNRTIPIIRNENVVFVHVDLETGDLNYIQRHLCKLAIEHTSIQLDGIGNESFDQNWEGLSRI
jgi:rubrerythrin